MTDFYSGFLDNENATEIFIVIIRHNSILIIDFYSLFADNKNTIKIFIVIIRHNSNGKYQLYS